MYSLFSRRSSAASILGLTALATAFAGRQTAQAQSIYGAGGLFLNPTADMPGKGQITPSALAIHQRRENGRDNSTWATYGVDYGVNDNLDIGVTYTKVGPSTPRFESGSAGIYAKYLVLEERPGKRPALAVGANWAPTGDMKARTAFAALKYTPTKPDSKHPLHLHLGAMYIDKLACIRHRELTPYAGINFGLTSKLSAFAEVRKGLEPNSGSGQLGTFAARSLGLSWKPAGNYQLTVVYGNSGWTNSHSQFGIGVGYSIGGGK